MSEPNPALAFQASTVVLRTPTKDGVVEANVAAETVFVRHRANPDRLLRVTAVDEQRGRWVCCAWQPAPDIWQHERYAPDELEEVRREPREVS